MRRALLLVSIAACTESTPPTQATQLLYSMTEQHEARNSTEAREYGLDLNGDKTVDNQLGQVFASLFQQQIADPQAATDRMLANGTLAMLFELATTDPSFTTTAHVAFGTNSGITPDLVGTADGSVLRAGPGDVSIVIAPFGEPLTIPLHGARVSLQITPTELRGSIGGGVTVDTVQNILEPAFAASLAPILARDCASTCQCAAGSVGQLVLDQFDTNHDCAITTDEIRQSSTVTSLTAPDIRFDGEPLLSFGVGIAGRASN